MNQLAILLVAVLSQLEVAALENDYYKAVSLHKTSIQIRNILDKDNALEMPEFFYPLAWCESKLLHQRKGIVTISKTKDVGLLQIHSKSWLEESKRLGLDIFDEYDNIRFAYRLYLKNGFRDWNASASCWSKYQQVAQK